MKITVRRFLLNGLPYLVAECGQYRIGEHFTTGKFGAIQWPVVAGFFEPYISNICNVAYNMRNGEMVKLVVK